MLREILDTRVMVKQGMKTSKGNKVGEHDHLLRYWPEADLSQTSAVSPSGAECQAARFEIDGGKSYRAAYMAWMLNHVLLQNVTYGYTGASFSGRMPCVEIADDIVQTGRETLEKVGLASPSTAPSYITDLDRKSGDPVYRIATSLGGEGKSAVARHAVRLWLTSQSFAGHLWRHRLVVRAARRQDDSSSFSNRKRDGRADHRS